MRATVASSSNLNLQGGASSLSKEPLRRAFLSLIVSDYQEENAINDYSRSNPSYLVAHRWSSHLRFRRMLRSNRSSADVHSLSDLHAASFSNSPTHLDPNGFLYSISNLHACSKADSGANGHSSSNSDGKPNSNVCSDIDSGSNSDADSDSNGDAGSISDSNDGPDANGDTETYCNSGALEEISARL